MIARIFRHRLLLMSCAILCAGLLAGRWGYAQTHDELLNDLKLDAQRAAAAVGESDTAQLSGSDADLGSPAYIALKARLTRYRGADVRVRFVYVFRTLPDSKKVIFLADSEPTESPNISLPGEVYAEADTSPGLQAILANGVPATEGPIEDGFGTWVTGYEVVAHDAEGRVRDVLGIDIAASNWEWEVWLATGKAACYVWVLFGLFLVGYVFSRREREQNEVIRNLSEAIKQSHTALMIVDLKGRIEYANSGFCQQAGLTRRDLIGRSWGDYLRESMRLETAMEITAIFNGRRNWTGEWTNKRKDGTTFPVRGTITAVRNRQNQVTCFVAIYQDLSEVRRNELILLEAKEHAEAGD